MPKWITGMSLLMLALLVGIGAYSLLTFTMFDRWREAAGWQESYDEAKKEGGASLERLFFDPAQLYAGKPCAHLDPGLRAEYEKAKTEGAGAVEVFLFGAPEGMEVPGQKGNLDAKLKPDYAAAKKAGEQAVDAFLFGPSLLDPSKKCARLDPALQTEYQAARKAGDADLDKFFKLNVVPNRWYPWLCLLGLFLAAPLLAIPCRPLFLKYNRRFMFIVAITGLLTGYFGFLALNNIYPMGIDLAGGTELIYRLDFTDVNRRLDEAQRQLTEQQNKGGKEDEVRRARGQLDALRQGKETAPDKATEVVRKRVDPTGAKGIPVTSYDEGKRIRIQLPKASPEEVERIKRAIRTQGRLTFHLVADPQKQSDIIRKVEDPKNESHEYQGYELMTIEKKDPYDPKHVTKEPVVIEKIPMLGGERVVFAGTARGQEGGFEVRLQFDAPGAARFEEVTAASVGRRMAVVLDRVCYSAPVIRERIAGECRISGTFTQAEANELSSVLTAGSLPAEVAPEQEFMVGPALGNEQIRDGVTATIIGTVVVALFMWGYYRLLGFVAGLCILLLLSQLMGALGFFKATMTLPGIAGILLNLAMAVDANVLIYERIREELERGRPLRLAVQQGFDRAFLTIIDSQLTTLISGLILYYVGTGPVRGFAVTLSIGILLSLFTNLWITRQIIEWIVAKDLVPTFRMHQLFKKTNFDFYGTRRGWIVASCVLAGLSLVGFGYMGVYKNDIYDVDFTGGSLVQFNFSKGQEQSDPDVKEAVAGKLKPALRARLGTTVSKLQALAASGKKGADLRNAVLADLPVVGPSLLGDRESIEPEDLTAEAGKLQKVLDDWDKFDVVVQSFGSPVAGKGGGGYRSYTLTTRLSEGTIVEALVDELNKVFAATMEPPAVALEGNAIRFRLETDTPAAIRALLPGTLKSRLESMSRSDEYTGLKEVLRALNVSAVKEETRGEGVVQPYLELTPVPADPVAKAHLLDTLEMVRLKVDNVDYRAAGPISRRSSFGAQVSGEMGQKALLALLAAMVGIFLYLWFRFEFSGAWGFGAIVALVHDSTIAVGACCAATALNWPVLVDLNLVAAVLTIIGYSVNDTIVIYDRIREVKGAHPTRPLPDIVNEACNATLSRTILTSLTVWLALVSLLIFGGPTVRSLAFTLWVGVIVGTYSSIFVASPLMVWWYRRYGATFASAVNQPMSGEASPSGAQL